MISGHLAYKNNFPKILDYLKVCDSTYTVPPLEEDTLPITEIPVVEQLPNIEIPLQLTEQ